MGKKIKEFRTMGEAQLNDRLDQLRMELVKLNTQVAAGTNPKSPSIIRQTKRNIARILTIKNTKKQGGAEKKV